MIRKDIKIIQLCSDPESPREKRSYDSLSEIGYRYIRIINPRYTEEPPKDTVIDGRTDWVVGKSKEPGTWGLTSGHYGCWQGNITALLSSFADNDWTILCECDCVINVSSDEFRKKVDIAIDFIEGTDYKVFKFESNCQDWTKDLGNGIWECGLGFGAHCYLVNKNFRDWWINKLDNIGWHTYDIWLNEIFKRSGEKMLNFKGEILTKQSHGYSLVDDINYNEDKI